MPATHKQNLLFVTVAALVASSVVAVSGLVRAVTSAEIDACESACKADSSISAEMKPSCRTFCSDDGSYTTGGGGYYGDSSHGSAYPSGGTAGTSTATSTTTGSPKPTCPTNLETCQKSCVSDGVTNTFCMKWCAEACPTTTTTSTSAAASITDRCAHANGNCAERVRCLIELAACSSPKVDEKPTCDAIKAAATARGVKSPAVNMETGMAYCDELNAAPPPTPVAEEPAPAVDVPTADTPTKETPAIEDADTPSLDEDDVRHEAAFEDDDFESERDFGGEYDDFGGYDDFDFPMDDFEHMGFDPMMMQRGFGEYFGGGDEFGGDFGGGDAFGGDFGGDFGGMPSWMEDELENMKDMMRDMAEGMCPDFVEEIDDVEDFEGLEELGFRMQEECMGEGGFGGPMEDPSEIVETLRAMTEGIDLGLSVLEGNGFDKGVASDIRGLLTQVNTAADEAEEACADLGFGEEDEDEGLFGLKGLLAQIFDDEEEDDADEDFGDDEEGEACREAIEKAFYLMDPDSDEDYPHSVRGIMQPAIEDFFRQLHDEDEAKSREVFAAFMKEMAPVVVGDEMELSDEDIDRMYDMLVASDFNFDAVGNPHAEGGEWEANFDNEDDFGGDFGEFDEEEEEGFEDEGGKAGGGGFNEEEEEAFNEEDFDV